MNCMNKRWDDTSFGMTYLEVENDLAERSPQEPSLRDVPDDSRRETEEDYHKISHGQIHDEIVCHSPHAVIPIDGHAH